MRVCPDDVASCPSAPIADHARMSGREDGGPATDGYGGRDENAMLGHTGKRLGRVRVVLADTAETLIEPVARIAGDLVRQRHRRER